MKKVNLSVFLKLIVSRVSYRWEAILVFFLKMYILEFSLKVKRDDFPFSIVSMSFTASTMPSTIFYSSVGAEIFRISRVCSTINDFKFSANVLVMKFVEKKLRRRG